MAEDAVLARRLGHEFSDPDLLAQALSHRSFGKPNNERLEFLGDSLLNALIAEALFQRFGAAAEGDLSRMRSSLVRGDTLAELGRQYDIGPHLRLGAGEKNAGGSDRDSILADALEAIIAAIYLDAGMERCRQCVLDWFGPRLERTSPTRSKKDPKTLLQEWLQARNRKLPVYNLLQTTGASHEQSFEVACELPDSNERFTATGTSRRRAEQAAARSALAELEAGQ